MHNVRREWIGANKGKGVCAMWEQGGSGLEHGSVGGRKRGESVALEWRSC